MGLSIKWFGHASFQLKADNIVIYIDPYQGEYEEKADVVLVTHGHFDHCDSKKIKMLQKDGTILIAPSNCASKIQGKIKTIKQGEKFSIGDLSVESIAAYNVRRFRSPGNPFHPKGLGVGYIITIGEKTVYHAGDTDFVPEITQLKNIDVALLPSGDTYTMDNNEAAEAALSISPKIVIPMHRWDSDPKILKKKVESKSKSKVIILKAGEKLEIELCINR